MKPDLDAIRARAQSVETDSSARACDVLLAYDSLSLLAYIDMLEHMLSEERENVDTLRARVAELEAMKP